MDLYSSKRTRTETNSRTCDINIASIKYEEKPSTINDLCSDVWEEIFQYFGILELFETFENITVASDRVLFNKNNHFLLRGLTLDIYIKDLSERISLNRLISLTVYETSCLDIIEHCLALRSLKLIGTIEWITSIIAKSSQTNTKLDQLAVMIPTTGCLPELLKSISFLSTLRRLEISADDLVESGSVCTFSMASSKIEQFILNSSSVIDWNNLCYMLPDFSNICLLRIGLLDRNQKSIPSFIFYNLRVLHLQLLEVSFNWIIQLVTTIPCLKKLKLSGLVDSEGFVLNQRWKSLFELAPTLLHVFVNVSLEQGKEIYYCEKIQAVLRTFNLNLSCNDDEDGYYLPHKRECQWWNLKGIITKH